MVIASGQTVYEDAFGLVSVLGTAFSEHDLDTALRDRVAAIVWDEAGRGDVQMLLADLATTDFEIEVLEEVISRDRVPEDWRVGEAIAEAYLCDHLHCEFPWPTGRDLKNSAASPAGTDLVGFQHISGDTRFAFAEVKTSYEARWPPSVMKSRHGLHKQVETLRDSDSVKDELVHYLAIHACDKPWQPLFQKAAKRYLNTRIDISVYGILIRDVRPDVRDVKQRAISLSEGCSSPITISLYGIYLPNGVITSLPSKVIEARSAQ